MLTICAGEGGWDCGSKAEAGGWDCGEAETSMVAAETVARLRGCRFAGLAGFVFVHVWSTGFGGLLSNGPPELCSWAALATTAVFAGRVCGFV